MTFTFFVYLSLMFSMILFAKIEVKYCRTVNMIGFPFLLAIILYISIVGLRYSYGDDFQGYLSHYTNIYLGNEIGTYFEIGYIYLCRFLGRLSVPPPGLFMLLAFINIFCVYYFCKKSAMYILPFSMYFFFCSDYGFSLSLNVLRQYLAFSLFLLSLKFIIEKKYIYYFFSIIFISFFHKSALICLPFYFLIKLNLTKHKTLLIGVMCILYLVGKYLTLHYFYFFTYIGAYMGYKSNIQEFDFSRHAVEFGSGAGFLLRLIFPLVIIYYSSILKNIFREKFNLLFNIYIIGVILRAFFYFNLNLSRILIYFIGLEFILSAFLCYYLLKINRTDNNFLIAICYISINFIFFLVSIENSANSMSPYIFSPNIIL